MQQHMAGHTTAVSRGSLVAQRTRRATHTLRACASSVCCAAHTKRCTRAPLGRQQLCRRPPPSCHPSSPAGPVLPGPPSLAQKRSLADDATGPPLSSQRQRQRRGALGRSSAAAPRPAPNSSGLGEPGSRSWFGAVKSAVLATINHVRRQYYSGRGSARFNKSLHRVRSRGSGHGCMYESCTAGGKRNNVYYKRRRQRRRQRRRSGSREFRYSQ